MALACSIASQIRILQDCVFHYYRLQLASVDDFASLARDEDHIDAICESQQKHMNIIIWPGLVVSSILFGLYLFDMALDVENYNEYSHRLAWPMSILIVTLLSAETIRYYFFRSRR